jgi:hypothetical protein
LLRESFEIAEDDRGAVTLGHPRDLAVKRLGLLALDQRLFGRSRRSDFQANLFEPPSPDIAFAGFAGGPERDAVEPGGELFGLVDRASFSGQEQKDGLKRILGRLAIAEDRPRDAENHRPVAPDQNLESQLGRGVAAVDERGQQGPIVQARERPEVPEDPERLQMRTTQPMSHGFTLPPERPRRPTSYYWDAGGGCFQVFSRNRERSRRVGSAHHLQRVVRHGIRWWAEPTLRESFVDFTR